MGLLCSRHNHRTRWLSFSFALAILFFATASAICLTPTWRLGGGGRQEAEKAKRGSGSESMERILTQKRLAGPGSRPPTCRSKCGRCMPCNPVHVPIQPGLKIPLEYYPEAWRCKCGNKLFMP